MTYLRRATHNTLYAIANSAAMNGLSSNTKIVSVMPAWQVWLILLNVVVGLAACAGVVSIILRWRKESEETEKQE
jgi:beta-glucosidase